MSPGVEWCSLTSLVPKLHMRMRSVCTHLVASQSALQKWKGDSL